MRRKVVCTFTDSRAKIFSAKPAQIVRPAKNPAVAATASIDGATMNFASDAAVSRIKKPSTILHAAISPRIFRSDFISVIMSPTSLSSFAVRQKFLPLE
ncbi:MAG: hypothetical protein SR1Q7_08180 [Quinella sp. 1Q7]|nr:hypothetical protein [Quinella sp. 1Q7]